MQNQNKVIKAGIGYLIGNLLVKGLSFLSIPIFVRIMTTEEFGLYNIYISYESIFCVILGISIHVSIRSAKYKYQENLTQYIFTNIVVVMISTLFWLVLGNLMYKYIENFLGVSRFILCILIYHCMATEILQIYNIYLSLEYSSRKYVIVAGINAVANIIISFYLIDVVFTEHREIGRIIGTALPLLIIAVYITHYFGRRSNYRVNIQMAKYAVKYSAPVIIHGISQIILSQFDRIMIKNYIGIAEAGIYSFAYNIYIIIIVIIASIDSAWSPWFFDKMNIHNKCLIKEKSNKLIWGMCFFVSIVTLISPEMVTLFGTQEYEMAKYCVIPISAASYFSFLYLLPTHVEYFYEKTKFISIGTISAAVINLVLNSVFIKKYGFSAAAYTTLCTYIICLLFHYVLAIKINGFDLFSKKSFLVTSIFVFAFGGISLVFLNFLVIRWMIAVILGVIMLKYIWINVYEIKSKKHGKRS